MALGYCPAVLTSLDGLFGSDNLAYKFPDAGALYALLDPQNTGDPISLGVNGHLKGADNSDSTRWSGTDTFGRPEMKVKFKRPNQVSVSSVLDCEAGTEVLNTESSFTLQLVSQKTIPFEIERIRNLCEDASKVYSPGRGNKIERTGLNTPVMNEVAEAITTEMPGLVADVNAKIWTRLAAGIGTNAGNIVSGSPSATSKAITLLNADGSPNLLGAIEMQLDKTKNKITGKPIVIGGSKYYAFNSVKGWGCCSQDGVDYGKVYQTADSMFYYDPTADTALAANQFLVLAPKSVQFVKHNRYQPGLLNGRIGISEYDTFRDSRLPLTWDIEVRVDNCPRPVLKVVISLFYDVWVQPAVWNSGLLSGNTGVLRYTATDPS